MALLTGLACLAGINIGPLLAQACSKNECEKLILRKKSKMKLKKVMVITLMVCFVPGTRKTEKVACQANLSISENKEEQTKFLGLNMTIHQVWCSF